MDKVFDHGIGSEARKEESMNSDRSRLEAKNSTGKLKQASYTTRQAQDGEKKNFTAWDDVQKKVVNIPETDNNITSKTSENSRL